MAGIFPDSGVAAHQASQTVNGNTVNCGEELFYSTSRCQPRFDPAQANAVISELINMVNRTGRAYDCSSMTNLADAMEENSNKTTYEYNELRGELTVTNPDGSTQVIELEEPAAEAYGYSRDAEVALPSGVQTEITNWVESYDPVSAFNGNSGRFIVPSNGFYEVSAALNVGGFTDNIQMRVLINGNPVGRIYELTGDRNGTVQGLVAPDTMTGYGRFFFTAGQAISIGVFQERFDGVALGTTNGGVATANWLSIKKDRDIRT